MARINLLPWRKEQRERKNKEFNVMAAATAGLGALLVISAMTLLNRDLSNQEAANQRIEEANAQLDVALKSIETLEAQREQMLAQMKVIQDLQGRRSVPVRVWDDMARAVPVAMYLENIKRDGDVITITGKADNANVVAALVRNLNASEWLDASAVVSIKSTIEAYQQTTAKAAEVAANAANNTIPTRPVYPEDNYVTFVVTTKVQDPQPVKEGEDPANQDVPLPPVEVQSSASMPQVSQIGVDGASAPATASSPSATGSSPSAAGSSANASQPQAQPTTSQASSPNNANATNNPVASAPANKGEQAGGQK